MFIVVVFSAFLFWIRGVFFAKQEQDYFKTCSRFDLGISLFITLYLLKLLLEIKGNIRFDEKISELSFFPFLIFGLLSISLARNRNDLKKDFLTGFHGIGIILTFAFLTISFGSGIFLLLLPYLSRAADSGYDVLKTAMEPVGVVIVGILRFLFSRNRGINNSTTSPSGESNITPVYSFESLGWIGLLERLLIWGLMIIITVALFSIIILAIFYLLRWLVSKTDMEPSEKSCRRLIFYLINRIEAFLLFCWAKIIFRIDQYKLAVQVYKSLINWGRMSGVPIFKSETPIEYGLRMIGHFPRFKKEIGLIIEIFNKEAYGELILKDNELTMAKKHLIKLHSPFYWPSRLKTRLRATGV